MPTLRQMIDGQSIHCVGTSEGAKLGWDRRGRKNQEKVHDRNIEIARFNPNQTSIFGPEHVQELQERHRSTLKKLKAGMVEDTLEQEENGAGASAH